ncbi:hypothetical protein Pmani_040163 [Petrolisthes manimaculis]|uniref:Ig-like domain-containing protein n=1 Tax=Petrolisthes manimaculis TaxID=1843537 RepID=A0AAE1NCT7_9EUCA|nr:hypothetical protein Pmani_040163 [Petrolisthes manimaculis]
MEIGSSVNNTMAGLEARAAVLQGGPDMHVQTGATLRLHCVLHHATENPEFIFWYHNNSMINYAPRRPLKVLEHRYSVYSSSLT